jgi:hypothetical protein
MSRSILTIWSERVRKRLGRAIGRSIPTPEEFDTSLSIVARELRVDRDTLLAALAMRPAPRALWHAVTRRLAPPRSLRHEDWDAVAAAAEAVGATFEHPTLSCWIVEPPQPADVYIAAALLAHHASPRRVLVVATHSDPCMVELGRSAVVPDTSVARAPRVVQRHLRPLGRCWQASPELRAAVQFDPVSPGELPGVQWPQIAAGFHLVVARGRLTQLEPQFARRVASRLCGALRERGFLLVAAGEHDEHLFFGELEPHVVPGVLLYQKAHAGSVAASDGRADFAALLAAIEADPVAFEPRWQLARLLLREGYAESAMAHLRELARWRPEFPGVWQMLAKAYTLAGDTAAAEAASTRASLASNGAPKMLM